MITRNAIVLYVLSPADDAYKCCAVRVSAAVITTTTLEPAQRSLILARPWTISLIALR